MSDRNSVLKRALDTRGGMSPQQAVAQQPKRGVNLKPAMQAKPGLAIPPKMKKSKWATSAIQRKLNAKQN